MNPKEVKQPSKLNSRKFWLVVAVFALWIATIVISYIKNNFEFARWLTPYVIGIIGGYLGVNVLQKGILKK